MVWVAEAANPQAWAQTCFSNIIIESRQMVVYVSGFNIAKFYRYNLYTNNFTALADPPAALFGQLAVSPDGTKVVGHSANGTVLYVYNISGNSWTTGAVNPGSWSIQSMVWADDDTIWCQVRSLPNIKFYKYVVSTNTWTSYANSTAPAVTNSTCMCISTDGTKLYVGNCGSFYYSTTRYTIATDAYAGGPNIPSAHYFVYGADRHKLWYGPSRAVPVLHKTITRWVNPDTGVLEPAIFSEYDPSTKPSNLPVGVYGVTMCIAGLMDTAPENLSETLASLPTVTTDMASAIGSGEAILNGTLDDGGGDICECGFEWGETTDYGNVTSTQSKETGETLDQALTGLDVGKLYHFRAFSTNSAGTSYGSDLTFSTGIRHYLNVRGINLPYEDLDGTKELHMMLTNLSPTAKVAGSAGGVKIKVDYQPTA